MVTITFNHYDKDGVAVDSDYMELSIAAISDIISQATEVILHNRGDNTLSVERSLDELDEALAFYGIIEDTEY